MFIDGENATNGVVRSLNRAENALLSVRPAACHSKIVEIFSLNHLAFFLKKVPDLPKEKLIYFDSDKRFYVNLRWDFVNSR